MKSTSTLDHFVPLYRCYALNAFGHIIACKDIASDDVSAAIQHGWHFVASGPAKHDDATGLEVWQGSQMLFSSNEAAEPDHAVTNADPRSTYRILILFVGRALS